MPAGLTTSGAAANVRFGVDMYSLGAQNWTPFEMLDWAARMHVNLVHFSETRFLGSPDWQVALAPDNLGKVKARADELNIGVEIGMRSICPTSSDFNKALGTADEQIARLVAAAAIVKSPIVRCVLGTQADRRTGIENHIAETVKVLKANRSRIMDAGVKMAIENHAGDMQARELKGLIEAAGPEYVGVCLDSGNPVWTIEDPHLTLDTLAPYVQTSHMRDSYLFNSPRGHRRAVDPDGRGEHGHGGLPPHLHPEVPGQAGLARGHRFPGLQDLQLPRSAGVGDLQDDPGVGVLAVPGARRPRHAEAAESRGPAQESRGRRSQREVDAGVSGDALAVYATSLRACRARTSLISV